MYIIVARVVVRLGTLGDNIVISIVEDDQETLRSAGDSLTVQTEITGSSGDNLNLGSLFNTNISNI